MPQQELRAYPLWSALPDDLWEKLAEGMTFENFSENDTIFPCPTTERSLCVLVTGEAHVYARTADEAQATLLRTMSAGALFGVHCIFSDGLAPQSRIVARKKCCVATIPAPLWEEILIECPAVMAEYVRFLTRRVQFLNQKIRYLTAGSAERRLALYLLGEIPEENIPVRLDLSASALADLLDLGRASLYRAIDKLQADGYLLRDGHEYRLLRRDALATAYL